MKKPTKKQLIEQAKHLKFNIECNHWTINILNNKINNLYYDNKNQNIAIIILLLTNLLLLAINFA